MGGGSKKQTVGYKYHVGMHMILCHGPVDKITKVWVDKRELWSGDSTVVEWDEANPPPLTEEEKIIQQWFSSDLFKKGITAPNHLYANEPNLFGGESREGGVRGEVVFQMGVPEQTTDSYLRRVIGNADMLPAYRGLVGVILRQVYIGMNPYLKPWSFRASRITTAADGGAQWHASKVKIGEDMNPIHIVREVLTHKSPDWGMSFDPADIDDAKMRAAADKLYEEGTGLSFLWSKDMSGREFIKEVLKHVNGTLVRDRITSKTYVKLIRDDYNFDNLRVLGEDTVFKVEKLKTTEVSEMANQVIVKYWDRASGGDSAVTVQNLALMDVVGGINSTTITYPGCCTRTLANKLAARDLKAFCTPLTTVTVVCNKKAMDIDNADVIRLKLPNNNIPDVAFRVSSVAYDKDGRFVKLELLQDAFSNAPSLTADEPPAWTDPIPLPEDALHRTVFEPTYFDILQIYGSTAGDGLNEDYTTYAVAAGKPVSSALSYSVVRGPAPGVDEGAASFMPFGKIKDALTVDGTVIELSSVTDLTEIDVNEVALIGDERVSIKEIEGTKLTIDRAVEDTLPQAHAAETVIKFIGDGMFVSNETYAEGQSEEVRLLTTLPSGTLLPPKATKETITFKGRQGRPFPPANIKLNGVYAPTELDLKQGLTVPVTFRTRNRLQQTAGYLSWFADSDITPEAGTTYHWAVHKGDAQVLSGSSATSPIEITFPYNTSGEHTLSVKSVRGDQESLYTYTHKFNILEGHPPDGIVSQAWALDSSVTTSQDVLFKNVKEGNLLVVGVQNRKGEEVTLTVGTSTAGWTKRSQSPMTETLEQRVTIYTKIATAQEIGDITVNVANIDSVAEPISAVGVVIHDIENSYDFETPHNGVISSTTTTADVPYYSLGGVGVSVMFAASTEVAASGNSKIELVGGGYTRGELPAEAPNKRLDFAHLTVTGSNSVEDLKIQVPTAVTANYVYAEIMVRL